jgi:hypothetical protein
MIHGKVEEFNERMMKIRIEFEIAGMISNGILSILNLKSSVSFLIPFFKNSKNLKKNFKKSKTIISKLLRVLEIKTRYIIICADQIPKILTQPRITNEIVSRSLFDT